MDKMQQARDKGKKIKRTEAPVVRDFLLLQFTSRRDKPCGKAGNRMQKMTLIKLLRTGEIKAINTVQY